MKHRRHVFRYQMGDYLPLPNAARYMGGGGGGGAMPLPETPTPSAPVTASSSAVTGVQAAMKRQQLRRRSLSSTIYAGGMSSIPATPSGSGAAAAGAAPSVSTGGTKTG